MTNDTDHRPLCMWVQDRTEESGSFQENPNKALTDKQGRIRCTKDSELAFTDGGVIFHACKYHAPEDLLEEIKHPVPKDRQRKGRIQV